MRIHYYTLLAIYVAVVAVYLFILYFGAFGGSWSHRNTFIGRMHRKLLSVFDFPVIKLIPPFAFYGGFLYVIFMFFSFLYNQMRYWSKQFWWIQHISAWVTPGPLLSFVVLFLVGAKYNSEGTYCKQCKYGVDGLYKYSYLTMTPICKRNAFWYFLFVLTGLAASAFFMWPILVLFRYILQSRAEELVIMGRFVIDSVSVILTLWQSESSYLIQFFVLAIFTLYFLVEVVDIIVFMIRGLCKRKQA